MTTKRGTCILLALAIAGGTLTLAGCATAPKRVPVIYKTKVAKAKSVAPECLVEEAEDLHDLTVPSEPTTAEILTAHFAKEWRKGRETYQLLRKNKRICKRYVERVQS